MRQVGVGGEGGKSGFGSGEGLVASPKSHTSVLVSIGAAARKRVKKKNPALFSALPIPSYSGIDFQDSSYHSKPNRIFMICHHPVLLLMKSSGHSSHHQFSHSCIPTRVFSLEHCVPAKFLQPLPSYRGALEFSPSLLFALGICTVLHVWW